MPKHQAEWPEVRTDPKLSDEGQSFLDPRLPCTNCGWWVVPGRHLVAWCNENQVANRKAEEAG